MRWALVWPASFAAMIDLPLSNEYLLHDVAWALGALVVIAAIGLAVQLRRLPLRAARKSPS